jgi:hypothetical protein
MNTASITVSVMSHGLWRGCHSCFGASDMELKIKNAKRTAARRALILQLPKMTFRAASFHVYKAPF